MTTGIIFITAVLYVLVVVAGIRMVIRQRLLPPHLKVLGVIVVLIFNIIPVGLYFLFKRINRWS